MPGIAVNSVIQGKTEGQGNGIRWNITAALEDLDFLMIQSLLYQNVSRYSAKRKSDKLMVNAEKVGLMLNAHARKK